MFDQEELQVKNCRFLEKLCFRTLLGSVSRVNLQFSRYVDVTLQNIGVICYWS